MSSPLIVVAPQRGTVFNGTLLFIALTGVFRYIGSICVDTDDRSIVSYEWFAGSTLLATGASADVCFAVGSQLVTLVVTDDGSQSDSDTVLVTVTDPPSGSATDIYVWDIGFTTKNRGKNTDLRILVDINSDSNADGLASSIDASAAGVLVTVDLYNSSGALVGTYTGTTNSQGVFQTNWIKGLANDTYTAEVIDLAHATFEWDPFNFLDPTFNDNDADGDGLPDDLFMLL